MRGSSKQNAVWRNTVTGNELLQCNAVPGPSLVPVKSVPRIQRHASVQIHPLKLVKYNDVVIFTADRKSAVSLCVSLSQLRAEHTNVVYYVW